MNVRTGSFVIHSYYCGFLLLVALITLVLPHCTCAEEGISSDSGLSIKQQFFVVLAQYDNDSEAEELMDWLIDKGLYVSLEIESFYDWHKVFETGTIAKVKLDCGYDLTLAETRLEEIEDKVFPEAYIETEIISRELVDKGGEVFWHFAKTDLEYFPVDCVYNVYAAVHSEVSAYSEGFFDAKALLEGLELDHELLVLEHGELRIRVGRFAEMQAARDLLEEFWSLGFDFAFISRADLTGETTTINELQEMELQQMAATEARFDHDWKGDAEFHYSLLHGNELASRRAEESMLLSYGDFGDLEIAEKHAKQLRELGYHAVALQQYLGGYSIYVGSYPNYGLAKGFMNELENISDQYVMQDPIYFGTLILEIKEYNY